jgi:hypothetical protein
MIERDSSGDNLDRNNHPKRNKQESLSETFNFSCVLRGEVNHLERIKEYIVQEYVNKGLVKLDKSTYEKTEIYIVTDEEWEEYQRLKRKDPYLIGPGYTW